MTEKEFYQKINRFKTEKDAKRILKDAMDDYIKNDSPPDKACLESATKNKLNLYEFIGLYNSFNLILDSESNFHLGIEYLYEKEEREKIDQVRRSKLEENLGDDFIDKFTESMDSIRKEFEKLYKVDPKDIN